MRTCAFSSLCLGSALKVEQEVFESVSFLGSFSQRLPLHVAPQGAGIDACLVHRFGKTRGVRKEPDFPIARYTVLHAVVTGLVSVSSRQ